ncbi:lipase 3-like isoform 2-T2 [Aphomia sociella]
MFKWLLVVALATTVAGRRSPQADYVEELYKDGSVYSPEIIEDALLDVPGLIQKYGYPVEVHKVITPDNYVLEAHRIPHGKDQNNQPDPNKPVVFILHGLISSSAEFVVQGPGRALAYLLADAGYDVWLGNARGNYYSRENLVLNPDNRRNLDFWRFSWDEIGNIDLPAYIDYILELTGQSKLHYIGHSQGCTAFLVLNSLRPEYNDKITSFHGMAPAAFFIYNTIKLINFLAPYEAPLEAIAFRLGIGEILGTREAIRWFALNFCTEDSIFHGLCTRLIAGDDDYFNTTLTPLFLSHAPAGSSLLQVTHYGQSINSKDFRRYDHLPITNIQLYGQPVPPAYDLSKITAPVHLHYGLSDMTTYYRDIYHLAERLPNLVGLYQAERSSFNHIDFVWATDAKEQVYDNIIALMQEAETKIKF